MMAQHFKKFTPGGKSSDESLVVKAAAHESHSDSGGDSTSCERRIGASRCIPNSQKLRTKSKTFLATFNINSLTQTGKLKTLTKALHENQISIIALQETRYPDEEIFESEGYRFFKSRAQKRILNGSVMLGTAFAVRTRLLASVTNFEPVNDRLSMLTIKCANKTYTLVNVHAPTNDKNRSDLDEVDNFWDLLDDKLTEIPKHHVKLLMGDFNAQLGREQKYKKIIGNYPAHRRTNKNGKRLVSICETHNLQIMSTHFRHLPRKQMTWRSPVQTIGEFQLDHVAISRRNSPEIMNVKVKKSINVASDHYMSIIKFRPIPANTRKTPRQIIRFDNDKLRQRVAAFQEKARPIDCDFNNAKRRLIEAAKEVAEIKRSKKHAWWNETCESVLKERLEAWKHYYSTKSETDWETYKIQRAQAARVFRTEKRKYEKSLIEKIDQNFKRNETREYYKTFKRKLNGYKPPSLCFQRKDGTLATSNEENCNILADYFTNLLNCDKPKSPIITKEPLFRCPQSKPPDKDEIKRHIAHLKNNKAPGEDSVVAELWKYAPEESVEILQKQIEKIWNEESLPEDWKMALIHPLHKKGSMKNINNYRGISLLPVTYKILSLAILERLEAQVEHQIGEYQGGFRKSRSTAEQIQNLKTVIRYCTLRSKQYVSVFVDFKKAYDSIDREVLLNILNEFGVDLKLLALIRATLTDTKSKVKFLGCLSDSFEVKTGVRQGDGLSPMLFNCVLEKIIRTWRTRLMETDYSPLRIGAKCKGIVVDCLAFADDIAILSNDIETARVQIELLKEIAEQTGLQISFEKTEVMTNIKEAPPKLWTKYGEINRVDKFKYLGEVIMKNGLDKEALRERIRKLEIAYQTSRTIYNKKCLSQNTKIHHYETVLKPVVMYAAETLSLNADKGLLEELEKKERRIIRGIMGSKYKNGIHQKRSNKEVYGKIEKITDTIRKRRARFYGHLKRMDGNRLTKKIFHFFDSKLKTTMTWFRNTKEDLHALEIKPEDAFDRDLFRKKIVTNGINRDEQPKRKRGAPWTDERKQAHSQRMKELWAQRKAKLTAKCKCKCKNVKCKCKTAKCKKT